MRALADARAAELMTLEQFLIQNEALMGRRAAAVAALHRPMGRSTRADVAVMLGQPGVVRARWDGLTIDQRRQVVAAVVERVVVAPMRRDQYHAAWDPERIIIVPRASGD
jgi:hypothetical protein